MTGGIRQNAAHTIMKNKLVDIQNQPDTRNIPLDRVGVKKLHYPIIVLDREKKTQQTTAEIEMSVDLPHMFRGTHMSRFVEILDSHRGEITMKTMGPILRHMKKSLNAQRAEMAVSFLFFIEKTAPISGSKSFLGYPCRFFASYDGKKSDFVMTVMVPVTTLCPCSKAISRYSAHNQRSMVSVSLRFSRFIWLEEIIRLVEDSASAEIFSLVKRPDEKHLTERAYENPRFAEDMVREVAVKLDKHKDVTWYTVETENLESIHAHSAYAFIKRDKGREKKKRRSGENGW